MKLKVKTLINRNQEITAEFEDKSLQDCIRQAGVLLDFDGKCSLCQGTEITLRTRTTKPNEKGLSYKYTEYVCSKCGATRQWGAYQDGSGFFLKQWASRFDSTMPENRTETPLESISKPKPTKGTDRYEIEAEIVKMMEDMYPEEGIEDKVKAYTLFLTKEGEQKYKTDLGDLSDKWLNSTFKKVKADHIEWERLNQGLES